MSRSIAVNLRAKNRVCSGEENERVLPAPVGSAAAS
jgi:hypothetical protein